LGSFLTRLHWNKFRASEPVGKSFSSLSEAWTYAIHLPLQCWRTINTCGLPPAAPLSSCQLNTGMFYCGIKENGYGGSWGTLVCAHSACQEKRGSLWELPWTTVHMGDWQTGKNIIVTKKGMINDITELAHLRLVAQLKTMLSNAQRLKPCHCVWQRIDCLNELIRTAKPSEHHQTPKSMKFLVFYACCGRSWFDWIQTRHLPQGWIFCHKCKSLLMGTILGKDCSRVSLQVFSATPSFHTLTSVWKPKPHHIACHIIGV